MPFPPTPSELAFLGAVALPLFLAFVVDWLWGDPAEGSRWERGYPPVLVGRFADLLDRHISRGSPDHERRAGAVVWVLTVLCVVVVFLVFREFFVAGGPYLIVQVWAASSGGPDSRQLFLGFLGVAYVVVATYWTKSLFTLRGLVRFCERPLGRPLEEKRRLVGGVVNRPTADLDDARLNSALIESAAENTTDSVVAPLLAYALFGLLGMAVCRAINTMDALLGHHDARHEHVGRVAATADRWVNALPDALAAALLVTAGTRGNPDAPVLGADQRSVPRTIRAASRVLGVRLERVGSYTIAPALRAPTEDDVRRFLRTVKYASLVAWSLALAVVGVAVVAGWTYFL